MAEKNNSEFKSWRTSVDKFRGYVRGRLETLDQAVRDFVEGEEKRQEDITEIKEYIAGRQAVQKMKSSIWGFFGSAIFFGLYTLVRWLIPKLSK